MRGWAALLSRPGASLTSHTPGAGVGERNADGVATRLP